MSSLSTEALSSQIKVVFIRHSDFEKEVIRFSRKTKAFDEALGALQKLLAVQFNIIKPQIVISPKHLHRVRIPDEYELWKVNCVATKGLRRSQMPRIYFARREAEIFFLCMGTHIDNYDDRELRDLAFYQVQTYFDINSE